MDLNFLRLTAIRVLSTVGVALAAITVAGAFIMAPSGATLAALLAIGLAVFPALAAGSRRTDPAARLSAAASVATLPALMLFVFQGTAWQLDLHMVFFAVLAMVVILCDWRAIALGTAIIAVHHLILGMAVPSWVFPGDSSFTRILLHAVILLAEAATLIWVAQKVVALLTALEKGEQQRTAAQAELDAERERQAQELTTVIENLETSLMQLAKGDLSRDVQDVFPARYASLRSNFNAALSSLRLLIRRLGDKAAAIDGGSREIAQASEDLARRTEANAATLEQTSTAIAQMDDRLRSGVAAAEQTLERAERTLETVAAGRSTADDTVRAMAGVSESAKGIDDVIEGLDKIAFQTRVLAMNAAVEAGRAGEAGRGFAVVADLVSALAMRAEEEAGRARTQLTTAQTDIAIAVEMVRKVDGALGAIVSDVDEVNSLVRHMAADHKAQAATIGEVRTAIVAMDQATQQNAAMVEQTSAAARNLSSEVADLAAHAAEFVVEGESSAVSRLPVAISKHRLAALAPRPAASSAGEWMAF